MKFIVSCRQICYRSPRQTIRHHRRIKSIGIALLPIPIASALITIRILPMPFHRPAQACSIMGIRLPLHHRIRMAWLIGPVFRSIILICINFEYLPWVCVFLVFLHWKIKIANIPPYPSGPFRSFSSHVEKTCRISQLLAEPIRMLFNREKRNANADDHDDVDEVHKSWTTHLSLILSSSFHITEAYVAVVQCWFNVIQWEKREESIIVNHLLFRWWSSLFLWPDPKRISFSLCLWKSLLSFHLLISDLMPLSCRQVSSFIFWSEVSNVFHLTGA